MTELRAIALTMAVALLVGAITITPLMVMHVSGNVIALAFVVILAVGADTCSRVGMHYSDKDGRR
jgi:uncharacterized membrane protein YdfJ with MMPL/SSD domain